MSLQNRSSWLTSQLLGALIGVLISLPIAAYVASVLGDTYHTRSLIYCGILFWVVLGALAIYWITHNAKTKRPITLARTFLWCISLWLWYLLLVLAFFTKKR